MIWEENLNIDVNQMNRKNENFHFFPRVSLPSMDFTENAQIILPNLLKQIL